MYNGPSVAVVILNFNGIGYLRQFLPALVAHTPGWARLVVADNASTDGSVAWLKENLPQIDCLELPVNRGYAGGYNEALARVSADVYVLLNSDVEVTPGWLEPVVDWLYIQPDHGAAMPKIRSHAQPAQFEYAGACGGYMDSLCIPFCRGRVMETVETDDGQYDSNQYIFWATGAALFIKAEAFWKVGGFDAGFFAHMEEVDLCWRLQLSGYKVGVVPASVVYHVGGGTLPKGERKLMLNLRNSLWMMARNLPKRQAIWMIFMRICIDWAYAFKEMTTGNLTVFHAVRKAHRAFLRRRGADRFPQPVQQRNLFALDGVKRVWIPVAYQILGKRRFSELVPKSTD